MPIYKNTFLLLMQKYKHYSATSSKVCSNLFGFQRAKLYSKYFDYILSVPLLAHRDLKLTKVHHNIFSMQIQELQPLCNYEYYLQSGPFLSEQDKIYGIYFSCLVTFQTH